MGLLRKATFLGTGGASGLVFKANSKKERTANAVEKQVRLQKQQLRLDRHQGVADLRDVISDHAGSVAATSAIDQLEKVNILHKDGVLPDEQFEPIKVRLLAQISREEALTAKCQDCVPQETDTEQVGIALKIHLEDIDTPYTVIGPVKARSRASTAFSKAPTVEDVNAELRKKALKQGATAVVNVQYHRGMSATSWKTLTAMGTAIVLRVDEVQPGS